MNVSHKQRRKRYLGKQRVPENVTLTRWWAIISDPSTGNGMLDLLLPAWILFLNTRLNE